MKRKNDYAFDETEMKRKNCKTKFIVHYNGWQIKLEQKQLV